MSSSNGNNGTGPDPAVIREKVYKDFWYHVWWYGEESTRRYYGTKWSPPVGSESPHGVNPDPPLPWPQQTAAAPSPAQPQGEQPQTAAAPSPAQPQGEQSPQQQTAAATGNLAAAQQQQPPAAIVEPSPQGEQPQTATATGTLPAEQQQQPPAAIAGENEEQPPTAAATGTLPAAHQQQPPADFVGQRNEEQPRGKPRGKPHRNVCIADPPTSATYYPNKSWKREDEELKTAEDLECLVAKEEKFRGLLEKHKYDTNKEFLILKELASVLYRKAKFCIHLYNRNPSSKARKKSFLQQSRALYSEHNKIMEDVKKSQEEYNLGTRAPINDDDFKFLTGIADETAELLLLDAATNNSRKRKDGDGGASAPRKKSERASKKCKKSQNRDGEYDEDEPSDDDEGGDELSSEEEEEDDDDEEDKEEGEGGTTSKDPTKPKALFRVEEASTYRQTADKYCRQHFESLESHLEPAKI